MKRRLFTKSIIAGLGMSSIPASAKIIAKRPHHHLCSQTDVKCQDGLLLTLDKVDYPTRSKDEKQFTLTYTVNNHNGKLEEKIYRLVVDGKTEDVYMTPINDHQLQAVFNWRLNA